jgi:hypothetical protein
LRAIRADANCNANSDCDSYGNHDTHVNCYANTDSDTYGNANANSDASSDTYTKNSPDPAESAHAPAAPVEASLVSRAADPVGQFRRATLS